MNLIEQKYSYLLKDVNKIVENINFNNYKTIKLKYRIIFTKLK